YLTKPVKQSELLNAILHACDVIVPSRTELVPTVEQAQRPLRILLAEDNPINQRLALGLLEKQGYTVVVAGNGQEAVDILEASQAFDGVLMDVQMPVLGGFEATAVIREREKRTGRHIPIIAMTAHALKGDRERCLEAGMDDYVAKPVRGVELFEAIQRQ